MEGENQALVEKENENVNNQGNLAQDKDFGSVPESEDDFPKHVISEAEKDNPSAEESETMNSRNDAISSIPLMEEHIHLCHERINEYENEQKRLESTVVLLGKTLSNVVNTLQVFQGDADFANQNVGDLLSGVKNTFMVLKGINVKDEEEYKSALLQVENEGNKGGKLMVKMEDSIESSMELYSSQQSSIDLLQTTIEISEEHLFGFLAKFWQKLGAMINAVNNPEDKRETISSKEMTNLLASLDSDISELCIYLKKKCELLKQMKSSLSDSEFNKSLSGIENKLNIKSLLKDMKGDMQESPFNDQNSELINVKDQTDFIIRQLSDRKNNSHKFVKYFNNEPNMRLEEIIVNSSELIEKCEWSGKGIHPKSEESGIELDGVNLVTIPHADLDKLSKEGEKWKKACHSLKNVVIDLMEHINSCEEELNSTLVQSILRMSGVHEESEFVNGKSSGENIPRRVHFAPSALTKILPHQLQDVEEENLVAQLEESSEDLHKELQTSLERLRREANALLSLSGSLKQKEEDFDGQSQLELIHKISLIENQLKAETMEKDKLKIELHELKAFHEGQSSTEDALLARAIKAESQLAELLLKKGSVQENVELITEGIGEGHGHSNFDKLQYKLTQLKEKARGALQQHHKQGENSSSREDIKADPSMFHFVEVLCCEVDRLFEDAKRENEDLQLQVESADKQLRSTRAFLEEQTIEREQEREEFQKELNQLCEALSGRERDREEKERVMREDELLESETQDEGINVLPRPTVEGLEQKCKKLTDLVKDANIKKDKDEAELKAAVDKIWDLRDIIHELESQVENAHQVEQDLRSQNENLIVEVAIHKKKLDDLLEELESLCSSLVFNPPTEIENKNHTMLLKEAIRNHCAQVEQAKALASSFKDFKKQLVALGTAIDMKTKELEALQVTPVIVANCNSPSEDVSVREQLEQATWRSESPLEDDFSRRDLSGNTSEIDVECLTAFALPKVPFAELCHLQEKLGRYSQAQEPLLKRMHDLEMQIQSLKQGEEELITEREVLQSQVEEQLLQASELQARLDEARQRGGQHNHCLSAMSANSPLGSPSIKGDLPSFCCTALAEARHEVENLTECIEKKELEMTQLRRALEDSKKVVALQEKQITDKAKEEADTLEKLKDYEQLKDNVNSLQLKLSSKINIDNDVVPFSLLLDQLLTEKNEEIEMLRQKILNMQNHVLRISANEENASHKSKSLTELNHSKDGKDITGYIEKSSSGSQDEVEVLRDREMGRSSFEQLGGDVYHQEMFPKLWLHSTKVDMQNSPLDTSELTFSPVKITKNEQSIILREPDLVEESLQKSSTSALSYSSSNSKDKPEINIEGHENTSKKSSQSIIFKDVGSQASEEISSEDLRLIIINKEGEIEAMKIKVEELSENRDALNQVIMELREKVEWHSKHLEKYEEESLGREALIAQVQMEKSDLESSLKLAEQEVIAWKSSHDKIKEKVKSQEEQIEVLKAKVDKYCKANKEQHLLLKTAQQERKQIHSIISSLGTGDNKDNENKNLQIFSPSSSLKTLVTNLVDRFQCLSIEVSNLKSERDKLKEDLEKEPELLDTNTVKGPLGNVYDEGGKQESRFVNPIDEKIVPNSIQVVRGSSPSLVSLEQMMQKVQQEGIEVLNLSELAVGKRTTPVQTPICVSPFDSPKSGNSLNIISGKVNSSAESLKTKQVFFPEDERAQLLQQIQTLENELSAKEREDLRRRDWMEFQEKEGIAGWCGMIETIGQKQRHELNILEQLGQQRNARAKLEASVSHLQQQISQAETELSKVTYRLGMERSHVIRLESALQQEKSNFNQLQQSLDMERKRANMMKELNLKVSETLQSELVQCQSKCMYLLESLKEEHELRMELDAQLKRIQRQQEYAGESADRDNLGLDSIPNEERRQLRKMEEECERKALELELESEKHRRSQYQKELLQLRSLLESRSKQEMYYSCRRWSSSGFPPGSDTSFNAEDMLQNLKGINQVLGWHVRERNEKQKLGLGSFDMEKYLLEAKCNHLEQKLESLMAGMKEHNLRTGENSFAMVDGQPLPKLDGSIHPQLAEELMKFKELVQRLYSLYWRSERNRKALSWQKQYFLSVLNASKTIKSDRSLDVMKSNDVTGLEKLHYFSWQSARKQKSHGSFRVLVWTVIATLRMKVLVLRSIAGIQVGCQSLIDNVLPTHFYSRSKH